MMDTRCEALFGLENVPSSQHFAHTHFELRLAHTQKHKQTDGKVSLRICNAGSKEALHKVT